MAKIRCPILFSQQFKINPQLLEDEGIFDPFLNIDTKLFIDPLLLAESEHEIFRNQASNELRTYYENIISLLQLSKKVGDFAYINAVEQLPKKEITGTCLGYGTNSTSGRGIPYKKRKDIINTASEIIQIGTIKPELFIILPLFNNGIGSDTISDITTSAIINTIFEFTEQVADKLKIKTLKYSYDGKIFNIIKNPLCKKLSPILLLPRDILRALPFASTWDEVEDVASINNELRIKFNRYLAMIFEAKTKTEKERQLQVLMKNKEGVNTLFEIVSKSKINPYDFISDKEKILYIHPVTKIISMNPMELFVTKKDEHELNKVVKQIIDRYKFLIENKGMNTLLWKDKENPNKEEIAQKIFHLVADSYCKNNDIDINPEMDTGIGYVDFKFSKGFSKRVIVEIKLSRNPNLINGFITQLELYKKSEETFSGYYIVIDVGNIGKKLEKLTEISNAVTGKKSDIIYIDAIIKSSASKRKLIKPQEKSLFSDFSDDFSNIELPDFNVDIQGIFSDIDFDL